MCQAFLLFFERIDEYRTFLHFASIYSQKKPNYALLLIIFLFLVTLFIYFTQFNWEQDTKVKATWFYQTVKTCKKPPIWPNSAFYWHFCLKIGVIVVNIFCIHQFVPKTEEKLDIKYFFRFYSFLWVLRRVLTVFKLIYRKVRVYNKDSKHL